MNTIDVKPITKIEKINNVASVPQLSPFRYPGGKTWFVPYIRQWLSRINKPSVLIEPFAGGGIIGLTAANEGLADHIIMAEKDPDVAAVWHTILGGDGEWLAQRILGFNLTYDNCVSVLSTEGGGHQEAAFRTIIKNRINHGGIMAAGAGLLKKGEAGKGLSSRWYPATLAKRIRAIDGFRKKISFLEQDGLELIEQYRSKSSAAFFIDPPYTAGTKGKRAGSRLYTYHELDHPRLFQISSEVQGQFLMTYDNDDEVIEMALAKNFSIVKVNMRSTHHKTKYELVVTPSPFL